MRDDDPVIEVFRKSAKLLKRGSSDSSETKVDDLPRRGSLEELIDSDIYEAPYVGRVEGDAEAEIRRVSEVIRLVIDPVKIDYDARLSVQEDMDEALAERNGFPLATTSAIADAVKGEKGKQRIKEIVQFYKGKVPPRFRKLLIEGMALRISEDNSPMKDWEVRDRKKQIAKNHEKRGHSRPEAYAVASLCSSGYFDSERLFQRIYEEQVECGTWSDGDYANTFEELVNNKPFVVFVKDDDDAHHSDFYHEMLGKSLSIDEYRYPLQFIDIRGKGEARETVERVVDYIDEHHPDADVRGENKNEQTVARVFHETL